MPYASPVSMKARCKIWLEDEEGRTLFGEGGLAMLEAVERRGSMNRAARDLGMSYRTLWGRVHALEARLGHPLVETCSGGGAGRGTRLLPRARALMDAYRKLKERTGRGLRQAARSLLPIAPRDRDPSKRKA